MKKIAILYGGKSTEHDVSCLTANFVKKNLDTNLFNAELIFIDQQNNYNFNQLKPYDCVFLANHGGIYENGCVQGILEYLQIPYTGSGVLGSAIMMNKHIARNLAQSVGVNVTPGELLTAQTNFNDLQEKYGKNLFIKPVSTGSSVGISKVGTEAEFNLAIAKAQKIDHQILIEAAINGQEVECAVLGDKAASVGEVNINPKYHFYDYQAKYIDLAAAELIIPANISAAEQAAVCRDALKIFEILQGRGYARIDFFIQRPSGKIIFNEANSLPGMTPMSLFPKLWAKAGIDHQNLLTKIIQLAMNHEAMD